MEEIKMALDLKKSLDKLRPIDVEQENRIMQKFRLDWNYHSNHLEGNSLNYGETKALLLFGITAQGKPLKDHFEITGHNEAINWVIDMVKGERPLTENFIRELHKLLLKEPYEVDAVTPDGKPTKRRITIGQYKTTPNHVKTKTGEIFYFATPEETPSKMFDLLQWFTDKTNEKEVNPIFLAVEFHYKFIRIHPFDDGNGRTARILMNFILMQFGFPPVIIKTEDKDNYFIALQLADAGNIEAFITYIAQNLVHSLELMIAGAKGENIEEEDDLDKEIALLEQKMKSSYITREDKANKLSLSLIDLIDGFYNIYLKFKKLYKNSDYKFYLNDELFVLEYDKNKLLNFLNESFLKEYIQIDILLVSSYSNFLEWKNNSHEFNITMNIEFEQNYYDIILNQEQILEKKIYQSIEKKELDKIILKAKSLHINFIEQKIAEKENK